MKFCETNISILFFLIVKCQLIHGSGVNYDKAEVKFARFIHQYNKQYRWNSTEYRKRLSIFQDNLRTHERLNKNRPSNVSAIYGVTKFSDLTADEFKAMYLSSLHSPRKRLPDLPTVLLSSASQILPKPVARGKLPKKVDWRSHNIVTPVKNQKSCGGCWAFSTIETVESRVAYQTGRLAELSPQEVLDCSVGFLHMLSSCYGGDTCTAFQWMLVTQTTLVDDERYPTTDKFESCKIVGNSTGIKVKSFTCNAYIDHEDALATLISQYGPVSVTVDATNWYNYQGGIIQYHCGRVNNHAVVIVGYDFTGPVPYYIVRNSWGVDYGLDGYLHVKFGNDVCGISQEVATVEVFAMK